MSTGYGSGDGRITKAINDALHSPLLNNNDIYNSQKILLHIAFCGDDSEGSPSLMMEEMGEIHEFMEKMQTADIVETKWGLSVDASLKEKVKVTILATGFGVQDINTSEMTDRMNQRAENERKRMAERTEKDIENEIRRRNVYGDNNKGGSIRKFTYCYVFKDEDLDNDDVISMVETIPTYRRKREDIRLISDRSNTIGASAPAAGSVISFT